MGRYVCNFRWDVFLMTLVLAATLAGLCVWQVNRYEQKRAMVANYLAQGVRRPVALTAVTDDFVSLRHRRVVVEGHYDNAQQFLLDNRVHNGQLGAYVITPLRITGSEQTVLVNRGWVAHELDRRVLPDISVAQEARQITGQIDHFSPTRRRSTHATQAVNRWPVSIQGIDHEHLSQSVLQTPLLPVLVLLDASQSDGYYRDWQMPADYDPGQHRGYAVQWFAMLAVLIIVVLRRGMSKR